MEVPEPATDSARSKAHPSRSVARRRMLQMVKPRRTPQPAFDLGETSQTCRGPRLLLPKCPPRRPLTASTARPLLAPSACCPSPSVPEDTDPTQGTYDDVVIHSSRQPAVRGMPRTAERRSQQPSATTGQLSITRRHHLPGGPVDLRRYGSVRVVVEAGLSPRGRPSFMREWDVACTVCPKTCPPGSGRVKCTACGREVWRVVRRGSSPDRRAPVS